MRWYKGWIETIRLAIMMNQSCRLGYHNITVDGQCWCKRRKAQTTFQTAEFGYDDETS